MIFIETKVAEHVARAALAAHVAETWADQQDRDSDNNPQKMIQEFKEDAQNALADACEYARADEGWQKVKDAADRAEEQRDLCIAAAKAANAEITRLTATPDTVRREPPE